MAENQRGVLLHVVKTWTMRLSAAEKCTGGILNISDRETTAEQM